MKIKAIVLALAVSGLLGFAKADNVSKLVNDPDLKASLDYFNKLNPKDPKTIKKIIVTLLLAFTYIKDNKTQSEKALSAIIELAQTMEKMAKKLSKMDMEIEMLKAEHSGE